jgi:TRAP-type mannitol/chloroaromatic compound transport system permease large subunit
LARARVLFHRQQRVVEIYLSTLPFFLLLLACVALIAFWPRLSLVLLS